MHLLSSVNTNKYRYVLWPRTGIPFAPMCCKLVSVEIGQLACSSTATCKDQDIHAYDASMQCVDRPTTQRPVVDAAPGGVESSVVQIDVWHIKTISFQHKRTQCAYQQLAEKYCCFWDFQQLLSATASVTPLYTCTAVSSGMLAGLVCQLGNLMSALKWGLCHACTSNTSPYSLCIAVFSWKLCLTTVIP